MHNRFLTLSAVAALVPTLAIAQQRPTPPPAQPPAARPTTPPAQQPAARPAQPPAQQPAARPATPPPAQQPAARPAMAMAMRGPDRGNAWEITIQGGLFSVDKALGGAISGAGAPQFLYGGSASIAKHINDHIGIGVGAGFGTGSNSLSTIRPSADITWTSDINSDFSIFIPIGVGIDRLSGANSKRATSTYGAYAGLGIRKFFSEGTALRIEGRMAYDHFSEACCSSAFNGQGLVGLSFFPNAGPPRDTDADGVPDNKDACPNTPRGAIVDARGCPRDSDHDGVFDGLDRCPNTPANTPVDANGCPRDSDGDGVVDNLDRCPNTPRGTPVDANGCPRDTDGDGVTDDADRCPNTPANARPVYPAGHAQAGCPVDTDGDGVADYLDRCPNTASGTRVDASGCPIEADTDHDGVPDSRDRCPNTPAGRPVDANGCPFADLPTVGQALVLRNVLFTQNSARLAPSSNAVLDGIAAAIQNAMRAAPNARFEVGGYTDNRGVAARNRTLSENRAKAVMAYLVSKGLSANALTARGYGPDSPKVPNTTAANRATNRRVEIKRVS